MLWWNVTKNPEIDYPDGFFLRNETAINGTILPILAPVDIPGAFAIFIKIMDQGNFLSDAIRVQGMVCGTETITKNFLTPYYYYEIETQHTKVYTVITPEEYKSWF